MRPSYLQLACCFLYKLRETTRSQGGGGYSRCGGDGGNSSRKDRNASSGESHCECGIDDVPENEVEICIDDGVSEVES